MAKGRYLLTGSQEAPLMKGVTESMAGRVAVFQLLPFSMEESPKVSTLLGGFPEVLARPAPKPVPSPFGASPSSAAGMIMSTVGLAEALPALKKCSPKITAIITAACRITAMTKLRR